MGGPLSAEDNIGALGPLLGNAIVHVYEDVLDVMPFILPTFERTVWCMAELGCTEVAFFRWALVIALCTG